MRYSRYIHVSSPVILESSQTAHQIIKVVNYLGRPCRCKYAFSTTNTAAAHTITMQYIVFIILFYIAHDFPPTRTQACAA